MIDLLLFPFETWEQCTFSSENFALNFYPAKVLACAFIRVLLLYLLFLFLVVPNRIELLDFLGTCVVFWSFSSQW